jgi:hypothetical protein
MVARSTCGGILITALRLLRRFHGDWRHALQRKNLSTDGTKRAKTIEIGTNRDAMLCHDEPTSSFDLLTGAWHAQEVLGDQTVAAVSVPPTPMSL